MFIVYFSIGYLCNEMSILNSEKILDKAEYCLDYGRDLKNQGILIKAILLDKNLDQQVHRLIKSSRHDISSLEIKHDAIFNFIKVIQKPDFQFTVSPKAYLKKVVENVFFMKLRKLNADQIAITSDKLPHLQYVDLYFMNQDRNEVVLDLLKHIPEDCKEVLLMWAMKFRLKEIAKKMNYSSEKYAKKKKHICLKKLVTYVESNPKLKEELRNYV